MVVRADGPVLDRRAQERDQQRNAVAAHHVEPGRGQAVGAALPHDPGGDAHRPPAGAHEGRHPRPQVASVHVGEEPLQRTPQRDAAVEQVARGAIGGEDLEAPPVGDHDRLSRPLEGGDRRLQGGGEPGPGLRGGVRVHGPAAPGPVSGR